MSEVIEPVNINDLVNDALQRWVAVTGTDPKRTKFRIRVDGGWDEWELKKALDAMNASRVMDPSGITTFMLLRGYAEEYLREYTIAALEFLTDPEAVEAKLAPLRAFRDMLEDPRVTALSDGFRAWVELACDHYKLADAGRERVRKILDDKLSIATLRRDAYKSLETLEAHQFIQGDPDDVTLGANSEVFEFWNIQSLLQAMQGSARSGITLCLIRDPEEALYSFFVLAIRNGTTLTVLTDRERLAHRNAKQMMRRPDRVFSERSARHWFPYELLDVKVSEDQKHLWIEDSTSLVRTNTVGVKLTDLSELEGTSFLWLILLFDLIREKYGEEHHLLPDVSYTGDMIVEPTRLVGPGSELALSGKYAPLLCEVLTTEKVVAAAAAEGQWQYETVGHNRWLTERYSAKIPAEPLNTIGPQQLPAALTALTEATGTKKLARIWMRGSQLNVNEETLDYMDPLAFGSKKHLERERLWVARSNQMKVIGALALEEFHATKDALAEWYRARIEANLPMILDACAAGTWKLPYPKWEPNQSPFKVGFRRPIHLAECLTQSVGSKPRLAKPKSIWFPWVKNDQYLPRGVCVGSSASERCGVVGVWGGRVPRDGIYTCYDRPDVGANVFTEISPMTREAVAILAGVAVEELPWQLTNWTTEDVYTGNPILNRVDPEDWLLDNPWLNFTFRVCVALSQRSINARRTVLAKAGKLPPPPNPQTP